jgi:sigma-B regulation protein RsbU (phosphoserine phosphatase)
VKIERERLAQELKIGREIQLSMLPASLPEYPGLDLSPGYLAALEVSGDFYDLFPLDDHRLLFVVADSAGKGIPACLYSLGFRSALRSFAVSGASLSEMVRQSNDLLLLDTGESGFFVTAWIGLYDSRTGKLEYCSQGHPPALLRHDGKLKELSTQGISFGVEEFVRSPVEEIILHQGDTLLVYTDGVIEAHDPDRNLFGMDHLKEFVLESKENTSAEFVEDLLSEIKHFAKGQPQFDDITLLCLMFSR